jgi:two-component system response regulator HydG
LVVDDEANARHALVELLRNEGYEVRAAADGFKALGTLQTFSPDVLITDLKMPGMDGIELMVKLRQRVANLGVIVMTAFASVESAVDATHKGADGFLTKPLEIEHLLDVLERVTTKLRDRRWTENADQAVDEGVVDSELGLVGCSQEFRELLEVARQVAPTPTPILITGESGTGKRLLARVLHRWAGAEGELVMIECGEGDATSMHEQLFPSDAGPGQLEPATGRTVLLRHVESTPPEIQSRLASWLRETRREDDSRASARVIATTEVDLRDECRAGRFNENLLHQLDVITLHVPALADRRGDIPLMALHFLREATTEKAGGRVQIASTALRAMENSDWSGNVRELKETIEHAVAHSNGRHIGLRDLPAHIASSHADLADHGPQVPGASLQQIERWAILRTLEAVGGSTSHAAEILGISVRKIQYRLAEYRDHDPSGVPVLAEEP